MLTPGSRYGMLTVIKYSHTRKSKKSTHDYFVFSCDCGAVATISESNVAYGRNPTLSCGCLRKARAAEVHKKHGGHNFKEYGVWSSMLSRCRNTSNAGFAYYGGRGIKVSERWLKFENFIADMGRRPTEKHTLERIDNNGDYCASNCVWATRSAQAGNRRTTKLFELNGEMLPLKAIAKINNVSYHTLWQRIYRCGMTLSEALDVPFKRSFA